MSINSSFSYQSSQRSCLAVICLRAERGFDAELSRASISAKPPPNLLAQKRTARSLAIRSAHPCIRPRASPQNVKLHEKDDVDAYA